MADRRIYEVRANTPASCLSVRKKLGADLVYAGPQNFQGIGRVVSEHDLPTL